MARLDPSVNVMRQSGWEPRRYVAFFPTNGAANPASHSSIGGITEAVIRVGVGDYTVVFRSGLVQTLAQFVGRPRVELCVPSLTGNRAIGGVISLTASGQIQLKVFTVNAAGAGVDIAADPASIVTIELVIDNGKET